MDNLSRLVRLDWRRCDQCGRRADEDDEAALRDMDMEDGGRVAVTGVVICQDGEFVMIVDPILQLTARLAIQ